MGDILHRLEGWEIWKEERGDEGSKSGNWLRRDKEKKNLVVEGKKKLSIKRI